MRQLKITKSITNRESQSLEKYLQEISKVDLISPEEEVSLAIRIKEGDHAALEKLTKANLRFVVSVAKQYQNQGLGLSDLINEGNLGLMKAAQRFDETRGFKFISYAVRWIRQSILQALAEQGRVVRLPLNKVGLSYKIKKAYSQLEQEYEREPSPEEIAELLDISELEVETTMGVAAKHVSIDAPYSTSTDDDFTMLDVMENKHAEAPDTNLMYEALQSDISQCLSALTENERTVITHYFGLFDGNKWELEDIGEKINLSRERVRQIKDKAINKLRRAMLQFGYNSGDMLQKQLAQMKTIPEIKLRSTDKQYTNNTEPIKKIIIEKKKPTPHPDIIVSEPIMTNSTESHAEITPPIVADDTHTSTVLTTEIRDNDSTPEIVHHRSKINEMDFSDDNTDEKEPKRSAHTSRFSSVLWEMCGDIADSFLAMNNLDERLDKLNNLIDEEERAIADHLLVPEKRDSTIEANITLNSHLFSKIRNVAILLLDVLSDNPQVVLDPLIAKEYIDAARYKDEETKKIAYHFFVRSDDYYSQYLKDRGFYIYAIEAAQNIAKDIKNKTGKKLKFISTS